MTNLSKNPSPCLDDAQLKVIGQEASRLTIRLYDQELLQDRVRDEVASFLCRVQATLLRSGISLFSEDSEV